MNLKRINNIPILTQISEEALHTLVKQTKIFLRIYSKGTTVHCQGETCDTLDIVISGRLAAYTLSENGSAMTMFEFFEKSIIGANLLFGNRHEYPMNIYCLEDCELLRIKKEAVSEMLRDYNFVMEFIKSLSSNSLGMNQKITMMVENTLRENILEYIRRQSLLQNSSHITLPISKKELADFLGVRRPSLFRELKRLKDEGLIIIENRSITLLKKDS